MVAELEFAKAFVHNKLHSKALSHLYVRVESNSLIIYSVEPHEEAYRALLTRMLEDEYTICIADPRGEWQLMPFVGPLNEMTDILTERLTFALTEWFVDAFRRAGR